MGWGSIDPKPMEDFAIPNVKTQKAGLKDMYIVASPRACGCDLDMVLRMFFSWTIGQG